MTVTEERPLTDLPATAGEATAGEDTRVSASATALRETAAQHTAAQHTAVEATAGEDTPASASAHTPGRSPVERTEPVWMLRVNPLRRTRLADPALAGVLGELARVEAELAVRATACTDALYERIGAAAADERAALVAVRRAVHNDRVPATLPDPAPAEFLAWLELRVLRDGLLAEAAEEHPGRWPESAAPSPASSGTRTCCARWRCWPPRSTGRPSATARAPCPGPPSPSAACSST